MAFFYFDSTETKQGPFSLSQIKTLAAQGTITPSTVMETDDGYSGLAGQINGLFPNVPAPPSLSKPPVQIPAVEIHKQMKNCDRKIAELESNIATEEAQIRHSEGEINYNKSEIGYLDYSKAGWSLGAAGAWLASFFLASEIVDQPPGCGSILIGIPVVLFALVGILGFPITLILGLSFLIPLLIKRAKFAISIAQSTNARDSHRNARGSFVKKLDVVRQERKTKETELWNAVVSENTVDRYCWFIDKFGKLNGAVERIYALIKKENTVDRYCWFIDKFGKLYDSVEKIYALIEKEDKVDRYCWFIDKFGKLYDSVKKIYALIEKENTVDRYCWFIDKFGNSHGAVEKIYALIKKENETERYDWFVRKFTQASKRNNAFEKLYELITKDGTRENYALYYDKYPDSPLRIRALEKILDIVKEQNSIDSYRWFLSHYSDTPLAADAWLLMCAEAFRLTKEQNTIEMYNRFIITFPYSEQVKEAHKLALRLEKQEYGTGNKAEDSRALLIKLKQISRQRSQVVETDKQQGYLFIEERMSKYLQDEFPREEATLRYLESEEFKDYTTMLANVTKSGFSIIRTELMGVNQNLGNVNQQIAAANQISAINVRVSQQTQQYIRSQAITSAIYHQELLQSQRNIAESNEDIAREMFRSSENTQQILNDVGETQKKLLDETRKLTE